MLGTEAKKKATRCLMPMLYLSDGEGRRARGGGKGEVVDGRR